MDTSMIIELVGYLGSVLVVVSMLMTSVVKLRVVNTVGASIFAVYALIIHSYPTALMNGCLVVINLYNLSRLLKKENSYDLIDGRADEPFLNYFLEHYKEDIRAYFPEFRGNAKSADLAYLVCTDGVPAGVLLGHRVADGTAEILLDYSTPVYRDCSVGAYLYAKLPSRGVRRLVYRGTEEKHVSYLKKMGFVSQNGIYVKELLDPA